MDFTDDDLIQLSKEELIALIKESHKTKKSLPKSQKIPSKQELFDITMNSLESEYGDVDGDLIINALVKTGRFSLIQARKCLSDASRACYVIESKSGCFRRVSTHI